MFFSSILIGFITTCCVALASLNHLPPEIVVHHAAQLVEGQQDHVTAGELDRFRTYAKYAGAAYCDHGLTAGGEVFCKNDICPSNNATYSDKLIRDLRGFVAIDHTLQEIIISFHGTKGWGEWWNNVRHGYLAPWNETICTDGCQIHAGWQESEARVHNQVKEEIERLLVKYPGHNVTVVGHSRGGALAIIFAARLRIDLKLNVTTYTYGAPRVGNEQFARFVSKQGDRNYRITHFLDPVPVVSFFRWGWRHVEPEYWLRQGPSDKVHYEPHDLEECRDWTEAGCIEGKVRHPFLWGGSEWDSHGYYLAVIGQCGTSGPPAWPGNKLSWSSTESEELMGSLRKGFIKDIEYAALLHNNSLLAEYRWAGWTEK